MILELFSAMPPCCCYQRQESGDFSSCIHPSSNSSWNDSPSLESNYCVSELRNEPKEPNKRHPVVIGSEKTSLAIPMQGYLLKRSSSTFKTWRKVWFFLNDSQIFYRKESGEDCYVLEDDLRLCKVKRAKKKCFEILTPSRSHMLQADSEETCLVWISALHLATSAAWSAIHSTEKHPDVRDYSIDVIHVKDTSRYNSRKTKIREKLARIPGNDLCCDCKKSQPLWASINLGVTLCIECSGVHRGLGVYYSKVRSLTLDAWDPEVLKVMAELGNDVVNKIYEAKIDCTVVVASPTCDRSVREAYIRRKWVNKDFVAPLSIPHLTLKRKSSVRKSLKRIKWIEKSSRNKPLKEIMCTNSCQESSASEFAVGEELNSSATSSLDILNDDSTDGGDNMTEVAVFGVEFSSVATSPLDELYSDDDSTDGEDDSTVDEEYISRLSPTRLLHEASKCHNIPVMCHAIALNADKLWADPDQGQRTHLHQAIISRSVKACEYLLLNGVPINVQDAVGNTPLHLATQLGNSALVNLLLKHRADQYIEDNDGMDPLNTAIHNTVADANIVTLLCDQDAEDRAEHTVSS